MKTLLASLTEINHLLPSQGIALFLVSKAPSTIQQKC